MESFVVSKLLDLVPGWIIKFFKKSREHGIIAEWREPDWFKFGGGYYSGFVPGVIDLWLQIYFRNTNNEPAILQSVTGSFDRETKFFGGDFQTVQPELNGTNSSIFPKIIDSKHTLPLYVKFSFQTMCPLDQFIETMRNAPLFTFKIIFHTKEGAHTYEKKIERVLDLKKEYMPVYRQFLSSSTNQSIPLILDRIKNM
jgi:hypothetical protein